MTFISADYRLEGRFKLQRIKATTGEVVQTLEFKNLITDIGLNRMGSGGVSTYTYVSTNSTPPSVLDTTLAGFLVATSTDQSTVDSNTSSSPYWYETTKTRRFAAGVAAGNLTKVGIGWAANPANALWSSALIVDGLGNPTTLTVLSDEFLDVAYTLRYYPPTTDSTFTVVIQGVTYTLTSRAANITSRIANTAQTMSIVGSVYVYGGPCVLGAVTGSITGNTSSADAGTTVAAAYTSGSYQAKSVLTVSLTSGNVAGGITALQLTPNTGMLRCATQMVVSPAIPKDATKALSLTFAVSWSRYP